MKRRGFISLAAASLGYSILATSCEELLVKPTSSGGGNDNGGGGGKGGGKTSTRNKLKLPSEVSPSGLTLQSKHSVSDLGGNNISQVWSYNDNFPGPTIRATRGSTASIQLQNSLGEDTITHWHGMIVDHYNDGHPIFAIPDGGSYNYNFLIDQRATLNWYHPHPHGRTAPQVYYGQAGAFIINDEEEAALGLPSGKYEVPLIIRDASLDKQGNLEYKPRSGGFVGKIPLVNGTIDPYLTVEPAVYRLRILNGANARIFNLQLSDGRPLRLIGNDGGLLQNYSDETAIMVSPGERIDVLVDFTYLGDGDDTVTLQDTVSGWNLLEFRIFGINSGNFTGIPNQLSVIEPLSAPVRERVFSFDGMSKINGQEYDMHRIDWQVPFGETELWRFTTNGNAPHPVHIHGAYFQVISRTGGRGKTYPWEKGWKDTVLLEDGETVEVLIKFNRFKGTYLMHCHKLEHEDMGMMANFEVV